jgi:poly(3-hydroxybutyrate) depolymerase
MSGEGLADGEHTFMLDGYDRRYILRLPQNYSNAEPWPLIFALHGNGGDTNYWDSQGGVRDIRAAFADEAILVIAEAIDNQWRDYAADPSTWPERIELELAYFDTVLEEARNELCIDDGNVFSMGFSGGGSFSGVLGCRREYIRAIAVGGSVIYFEADDCVATPAAWITIGEQETTADREAFRDFFRDLAGCDATSTPGTPDGCGNYDGCSAETPVTFCSHPAGHEWPSIGTDATKAFFQLFYGA